VQEWLMRLLMFGRYALEGLTAIFLTVVLAIYFVIEGKRTIAWLISFAPEPQRKKLAKTAEDVRPVMLAYMRGQLITSTTSAAAALAVLLPFGVPAAVPLAALAFIGDFVPVIGFLASIIPAVLMGLLVSPAAALSVAAVYIGYQLLENYVIAPKVYGSAMRLSTLAVLLTITVGGTLLGPMGAIILLPIVASYPAVERIWLARHLPADTVPRHEALENA
jgi:predicted PurR-regulated permease PerM